MSNIPSQDPLAEASANATVLCAEDMAALRAFYQGAAETHAAGGQPAVVNGIDSIEAI
jgi:hypothetical protein